MITNRGTWCQACVSTGAIGIRTATAILRREGYHVAVSAMGNQVTPVGVLKMTLLSIYPGGHQDTSDVTAILEAHIPELRH